MAIAAAVEHEISNAMTSKRATSATSSAFVGVAAVLFVISATVTLVWCASLASMPGMRMPGGWTMSMTWVRMPGQTWPGAAVSFLAMWLVMMIAMMLPSLLPMLWRYRQGVIGTGAPHPDRLTAIAGAGYFAVWTACGAVAFALGIGLAAIAMQQPALSRAIPAAAGVAVLIAGAFQFTSRKAHHLACCRETRLHRGTLHGEPGSAWRHGLALGLDCARCCANLMAILFVGGVMEPGTMAVVTAAITAERLAPAARAIR
jgi:predicted metal-binding membrane protein